MATAWQEFLTHEGAHIDEDGALSLPQQLSSDAYFDKNCITDLSYLGLLQISGPDTDKFLQGQLTCDLKAITPQQSKLGACCTPKGRMVTNFSAVRTDEHQIQLVMAKEIVASTLQHLSKYAVFFKAELSDASNTWIRMVISGPDTRSTLSSLFAELPKSCDQITTHSDGFIIQVAPTASLNGTEASTAERFELWFKSHKEATTAWQKIRTTHEFVDHKVGRLLDIAAGIGRIETNTQELFIPQMLNLQAIKGVSFNKGCYTGQEIVARMQYRGTLKRRMYRAQVKTDTPPLPGTECFGSDRSSQIGHIVNVTPLDEGRYEVLAVLENRAVKKNDTMLFQQDGPQLELENLPYTIELENTED
mgnify:FL=1